MQTMRTKGFSHGHVPVTALEMRGKGKRSYAFSEYFEDKSVRRHWPHSAKTFTCWRKLVLDLYMIRLQRIYSLWSIHAIFIIFLHDFGMTWLELTRTDTVFSRTTVVLFLCRNKSSWNAMKINEPPWARPCASWTSRGAPLTCCRRQPLL